MKAPCLTAAIMDDDDALAMAVNELLLGFGSARSPAGNTEMPTMTTAVFHPRTRPRPMGRVPQYREMCGFHGAHLLEVDATPIEPLDYVLTVVRPRVRGPFGRRMESVRQRPPLEFRSPWSLRRGGAIAWGSSSTYEDRRTSDIVPSGPSSGG